MSCTVALAVAGALAAVTVGSVFVFRMLPGDGGDVSGSAQGGVKSPAPSAASSGGDYTPPPAIPAAYLGTWEGQGTALDGSLPDGTFRLTVRQVGVGEKLGTLRQTDQLGGVCDDVLTLKRITRTQLVATAVGARTNRSVCNQTSHTVRLTPVGDDLKYESDSSAEGNPTARMSKVK
jgi:hypothetical protein